MRANIGCGPVQLAGWVNVDCDPMWSPPVLADLRDLPFPDGSFSLIVANHSLQMLDRLALPLALRELLRVCHPDGVLRVLVPDLMKAITAYGRGDHEHFLLPDEIAPSIDAKLCTYLTQGGTTRTLFTPKYLLQLLADAGWQPSLSREGVTLSDTPGALDLDSRIAESLIVEARPCV